MKATWDFPSVSRKGSVECPRPPAQDRRPRERAAPDGLRASSDQSADLREARERLKLLKQVIRPARGICAGAASSATELPSW